MKEYIAYNGQKFIIEWYHNTAGKSAVLEYYKNLPGDVRIRILRLIKHMGDFGEIKDRTKFNYEGDQIYAFKPQPERFLCFFFKNKKIIITNGFRKKQQKLPVNEKNIALKSKMDYLKRLEGGKYYE